MPTMRQLPQRPGQTPTPAPPSDADRQFIYPLSHPPAFDRYQSYPSHYVTHPPPQHDHGPYITYPNGDPQHGHGHLRRSRPEHGPGEPRPDDYGKKRPLSNSDREDNISPRRQSTSKSARHESNASENRPHAPSVLVREKKQVSR